MRRGAVLVLAGLLGLGAAALATPPREEALERAAHLRVQGQYRQAAAALRPLVRERPGDAEAALLLGQVLVDAGQPDEGARIWSALVEEQRSSAEVYRAVIERLRRAGLNTRAMDLMERAHRELDDPRPYAWGLTELCLQEGEYGRAVSALLDHLDREPGRLALMEGRLLLLVRAERAAGRGSDSPGGDAVAARPTPDQELRALGSVTAGLLRALDRAAETGDPARASRALATHSLRGSIALEAGLGRRGLAAYTQAADLPGAAPLIYQFASRAQAAGLNETASRAYALARAHVGGGPIGFQALLRQAQVEESAGHWQVATALYRQLADQYPGRPEAAQALLRVGQLILRQGEDLQVARAALERVLSADRSGRWRGEARQGLAECDLRAGDLAGARDAYEALLADGAATRPEALYGLAEVALYEGRYDAVVERGDSLVARHADHDLANDALELQLLVDEFGDRGQGLAAYAGALLLERQGRSDEAEAAWEALAETGPEGLRARSLLRWARLCRQPDVSLSLYERVVRTWPESPYGLDARLGRAALLERLRGPKQALPEYEAALLAHPESARAPQVRLEIERLRRLGPAGGAG